MTKISLYSYSWQINSHKFDYKSALDNWAKIADEIVISVNTSDDGSYESLESYSREKGYPVKLVATNFDSKNDPRFYGKVVDAALQACTGDIMIACDMDERLFVRRDRLEFLHDIFVKNPKLDAFYTPTIDLYGSYDKYLPPGDGSICKGKWYITRPGLHRGPVPWGIKADGSLDYNKSSCDEPIREDGKLAMSHALFRGNSLADLKNYMDDGWPVTVHYGYVDFNEKLIKSLWWKGFWTMATSGDKNQHPTSVEEIAAKETKFHGLGLT